MRSLVWLLRITLFLLLLGFAVKNSDPVIVQYYFGQEWRAPLVFVLFLSLCAGAVLGIVASLGQLFRQRREILASQAGAALGRARAVRKRSSPAPDAG